MSDNNNSGDRKLQLRGFCGIGNVDHPNFDIDASIDTSGMNALHFAACYGFRDYVQILIDHGADINIQNNQGNTALHLAVMQNRPKIIRVLIAAGADVTIQNAKNQIAYELSTDMEIQDAFGGGAAVKAAY